MTTPFKREPRYFVFKISDMRKHLSQDKFELVGSIAEKLNAGRAVEGKVPLDAVVVESDWPEYEYVWKMIEQRVTGLHEPENEPHVSMHSRPASPELHEAVDTSLGIIRTNQMQSKKELTAWPCEIETADFESDTITLKMRCRDYKISAGQYWLCTQQRLNQELQFKEFIEWANAQGYDCAHTCNSDTGEWIAFNPMTADLWKAWQAAHSQHSQRSKHEQD